MHPHKVNGLTVEQEQISVVIPFFDEFAYIEACLGSVLAAGDAVKEVILINDQPSANNRKALSSLGDLPKLRIIHNAANIGAFATRNVGISEVRGTFVLFLDADDMLSPAGLKEARDFAVSSKADLLYLPTLRYDPKVRQTRRFYRDKNLFGKRRTGLTAQKNPELRYGVANWSVLLRREFLVDAGIGFDPEQRRAADHLFLLSAVESAKSSATFDRWIHVWRNRGGSITTKKAGFGDFEMQLSALRKNIELMSQKYSTESIDFQRDVAFVFLRLIWNWSFFEGLLPIRDRSDEAGRLLADLSSILRNYPLQNSVFWDDLLKRASPAKMYTITGRSIETKEVVEIYRSACDADWKKVQLLMGIKDESHRRPRQEPAVSSEGQPKGLCVAPYLELTNESATENLSLFGFKSTYDEVQQKLRTWKPGNFLLIFSDPSGRLWKRYESRLNRQFSTENRRFVEFLLDEIEGELAHSVALVRTAREFGWKVDLRMTAVNADGSATKDIGVAISSTPAPSVAEFSNLTAALLRRMSENGGEAYVDTITQLTSAGKRMRDSIDADGANPTELLRNAKEKTLFYALGCWLTAIEDAQIFGDFTSGITRAEVSLAWMAVEACGNEDIYRLALCGQLGANDEMRFGDADLAGYRTFKSRAKYIVGQVKAWC